MPASSHSDAPVPTRQLYHDKVKAAVGLRSADISMPDNNTAERAMRSVAIGRKNYLFVGSQTGGRAAAIAYTLIETAKLNGVDPQGWLADTLACIPDYKITRVKDLLPWNRSNHAA
ncbi:transposase domain-containing protein [Paracoccus sp. Ld10]|uniref:transposase domain-containing protein n=1 Tax=Paracoccus sp. Ld10 TaxID=649158 RepID=UPI00386609DB